MKYGCIAINKTVNTKGERVKNIGDNIQLAAVMNLYRMMGIPEKDIVRIEYYDLFNYTGEDICLPINFIWFNPVYPPQGREFYRHLFIRYFWGYTA